MAWKAWPRSQSVGALRERNLNRDQFEVKVVIPEPQSWVCHHQACDHTSDGFPRRGQIQNGVFTGTQDRRVIAGRGPRNLQGRDLSCLELQVRPPSEA